MVKDRFLSGLVLATGLGLRVQALDVLVGFTGLARIVGSRFRVTKQ